MSIQTASLMKIMLSILLKNVVIYQVFQISSNGMLIIKELDLI